MTNYSMFLGLQKERSLTSLECLMEDLFLEQ